MAKMLVTAQAEYYIHVEADSEEEAIQKAKQSKNWARTMNSPMTDYKAKVLLTKTPSKE